MTHFISVYKSDDASHIAYLYFKEVIKQYSALRSNVSDQNTKFLSNFGGAYRGY